MNLSIRLFAVTTLAVLPLLAVLIMLQHRLVEARREEVNDLASRQAAQASSELARTTEGVRALLTSVASAPSVAEFRTADCNAYLIRLAEQIPHIKAIGALDLDGNVRCWSDALPLRSNYADREYFQEAVRTGKFYVGNVIKVRSDGATSVIPFSIPIRDDQGQIVGVAAASLTLDYLQGIVGSWPVPEGGSLTVADRTGVILARNPFPERFVGNSIPADYLPWITAASGGVQSVVSQDGTTRILAYVPATVGPSGFYVSSGIPAERAMSTVRDGWLWNGGALLAAVIGTAVSSALAARTLIRRPVEQLIELANGWAEGRRPTTPSTLTTREFRKIADALRAMGEGIERRSALMMAELNHRVKNTLALVQAMGSQTANHTTDPDGFNERFGERLRALARTHDLLTAEHWDPVGLRQLLKAELEITPSFDRVSLRGPEVSLPPEYAVTVSLILHELTTNAMKYGCLGDADGQLDVSWDLADDGSRLDLSWVERCPTARPKPTRSGFGSRLIRRSMASIGDGTLEFRPEGLVARLTIPMPRQRAEGTTVCPDPTR